VSPNSPRLAGMGTTMDSATQHTSPLTSGHTSHPPQLEMLEERLRRVESILSILIQESALQGNVSGLLRTQALLNPDTISSATERPRETSPYLDAEGAAAYLGITVSSLYGIVERGHLTPLRGPRRRYRFTKELLDDYLRRRAERR
jgi:excisionase family DNA binding protein